MLWLGKCRHHPSFFSTKLKKRQSSSRCQVLPACCYGVQHLTKHQIYFFEIIKFWHIFLVENGLSFLLILIFWKSDQYWWSYCQFKNKQFFWLIYCSCSLCTYISTWLYSSSSIFDVKIIFLYSTLYRIISAFYWCLPFDDLNNIDEDNDNSKISNFSINLLLLIHVCLSLQFFSS